jgi:hypothetical protein
MALGRRGQGRARDPAAAAGPRTRRKRWRSSRGSRAGCHLHLLERGAGCQFRSHAGLCHLFAHRVDAAAAISRRTLSARTGFALLHRDEGRRCWHVLILPLAFRKRYGILIPFTVRSGMEQVESITDYLKRRLKTEVGARALTPLGRRPRSRQLHPQVRLRQPREPARADHPAAAGLLRRGRRRHRAHQRPPARRGQRGAGEGGRMSVTGLSPPE